MPPGDRNARRLVSLGAVAALHVAIIAALLTLSHEAIVVPRAAPSDELIWFFPPPPPKMVAPAKPPKETLPSVPAARPRSAVLPDYHGITIPDAPPAAPSLSGLHGSLFGCADLDHLSPEERAHCGSAMAVPDNAVDFRDGVVRSRQAALWERGRLRKNGPLLLPCFDPNQPAGANLLGAAYCLAKSAVTGDLKPVEQPSYADKPETFHLPNNGDPPPHPTGF